MSAHNVRDEIARSIRIVNGFADAHQITVGEFLAGAIEHEGSAAEVYVLPSPSSALEKHICWFATKAAPMTIVVKALADGFGTSADIDHAATQVAAGCARGVIQINRKFYVIGLSL